MDFALSSMLYYTPTCSHLLMVIGTRYCRYYTRKDAEDALKYVNGMKLDDRIVRADWDRGFSEGRQYGRGKSGGQVRCGVVLVCCLF